MTKIERVGPPRSTGRGNMARWTPLFGKMQPGESFHFEDVRPQAVIASFCHFLGKGRYSVRKEGNGYRFYLIK